MLPEVFSIGGPSALLGIVFLMVMRGLLVHRRYLDDSIKREQEWKTIALDAMKANALLVESVKQVLDSLPVKDKT